MALSLTPRRPDGIETAGMFQKMNNAIAEAERLRLQCRQAAEVCAQNRQAVTKQPIINHMSGSVQAARAASSFAANSLQQHEVATSEGLAAPAGLGHLSIPAPTCSPGRLRCSSTAAASRVADEIILPGVVDTEDEFQADSVFLPDIPPRPHAAHCSMGIAESREFSPRQNAESLYISGPSCMSPLAADDSALPPVEEDLTPSHVSDKGSAYGGLAGVAEESTTQSSHPLMQPIHSIEESPNQVRRSSVGTASSLSEDSEDGSDSEQPWPPKAPVMRFQGVSRFLKPFSSEAVENMKDYNDAAVKEATGKQDVPLSNYMTFWLNRTFGLNIETQLQFETGFAIILFFMLDAVYRNKVPWHAVKWGLQYKRTILKNYALLQKLWGELNMEKARGFRADDTHLNIEMMPRSTLEDKLELMRLMKRWYDARIHGVGAYDAMARRREFVAACEKKGRIVEFPPWVLYQEVATPVQDHRDAAARQAQKAYEAMPEFKRLIWFLGSAEHQHM
eukprot:TRINITY_DN74141_c0_g1_i1.p1 TRINITY_DN74141_c0_g1~~TRINITY_DN74141_c0_g1_i1.p1  ORF type:complete len:506 (+),score=102.59 TRINITY_DN74141_c0_g1_i1:101-1618(+)